MCRSFRKSNQIIRSNPDLSSKTKADSSKWPRFIRLIKLNQVLEWCMKSLNSKIQYVRWVGWFHQTFNPVEIGSFSIFQNANLQGIKINRKNHFHFSRGKRRKLSSPSCLNLDDSIWKIKQSTGTKVFCIDEFNRSTRILIWSRRVL